MKKLIPLIIISLFCTHVQSQNCNLDEKAKEHWYKASGGLNSAVLEKDLNYVIEEYQAALKYAPDCPEIYFNMALCYEKLANYDKPYLYDTAIDNYQKYLNMSINPSDKLEVQDKIHEIKNKIERLVNATTKKELEYLIHSYYKKILKNDKNRSDIYLKLGTAYEKLAITDEDLYFLYDNAIDCFKQYLKLEPNAFNKETVTGKIYQLEGKQKVSSRGSSIQEKFSDAVRDKDISKIMNLLESKEVNPNMIMPERYNALTYVMWKYPADKKDEFFSTVDLTKFNANARDSNKNHTPLIALIQQPETSFTPNTIKLFFENAKNIDLGTLNGDGYNVAHYMAIKWEAVNPAVSREVIRAALSTTNKTASASVLLSNVPTAARRYNYNWQYIADLLNFGTENEVLTVKDYNFILKQLTEAYSNASERSLDNYFYEALCKSVKYADDNAKANINTIIADYCD